MVNEKALELKRSWEKDERWQGIVRPYAPEDVLKLRGSVQIEYTLARRGRKNSGICCIRKIISMHWAHSREIRLSSR